MLDASGNPVPPLRKPDAVLMTLITEAGKDSILASRMSQFSRATKYGSAYYIQYVRHNTTIPLGTPANAAELVAQFRAMSDEVEGFRAAGLISDYGPAPISQNVIVNGEVRAKLV